MNHETFELADGYEPIRKTKPRTMIAVRRMTVEEAKALSYGQHVEFEANDGTIRRIKVNGAPKTWKRESARVTVPVKYGMYEYGSFSETGDGYVERLVVRCGAEG